MTAQPTLTTTRLLLRPFTLADAPRVQLLAGDYRVAQYTRRLPHPYEDGIAEAWIAKHPAAFAEGKTVTFAIVIRADRNSSGNEEILIGAIGLEIDAAANAAELGYWLGVPYWNQGFATEAARAVVAYAFDTLRIAHLHACHFIANPASGRVLRKAGLHRSEAAPSSQSPECCCPDVVHFALANPAVS
jgi:RimJ/RimL family protein N-acetyltransferase